MHRSSSDHWTTISAPPGPLSRAHPRWKRNVINVWSALLTCPSPSSTVNTGALTVGPTTEKGRSLVPYRSRYRIYLWPRSTMNTSVCSTLELL